MNAVFWICLILLLLTAAGLADNDLNGNELAGSAVDFSSGNDPKNLHYEADIAYKEGRMSLGGIRVDNYPVSAQDYCPADTECVKLGADKTNSEYSENVDAVLCKYPDESYLLDIQEFGGCANRLASTRDREYELEITNATGEILLSCRFVFTIETQCFDCRSSESGNRSLCDSEDRFDFSLALPYHEDAKDLKIFETDEGKRKTVLSTSLSKFKNAPDKFAKSG